MIQLLLDLQKQNQEQIQLQNKKLESLETILSTKLSELSEQMSNVQKQMSSENESK
jgi:hypothetical protein